MSKVKKNLNEAVKQILKEWDPSMSNLGDEPWNQSDYDELLKKLKDLAEKELNIPYENLPSPTESQLEQWVMDCDPDSTIWSKYENTKESPSFSYKLDDIEGYENEMAPLIYNKIYKDFVLDDQKSNLWNKQDNYNDLLGESYDIHNYLNDNDEFIDAEPGDYLKLKNGQKVWVVDFEGGSRYIVTDDRNKLEEFGKELQYQIKKRFPKRKEEGHGIHEFDENDYYTWVVGEDEIRSIIKVKDVIVESKNKKMNLLKESIENYIPQVIKNFKHPAFNKIVIGPDDDRYSEIEKFLHTVSEQDYEDDFMNWCLSNGFDMNYDIINDCYIIKNVGAGISENKKSKNSLVLKEVGGGLNLDQVVSEVFTKEEKKVLEIIEKKYKDYTILKSHYNTDYITLNLTKELDSEISEDLELKRFLIAKDLSQLRQDLISDLSSELPVVNITVGPYQFVKGSDNIILNVTILLSDTGIKDWVTGKINKK